jgi:hypothetical protein
VAIESFIQRAARARSAASRFSLAAVPHNEQLVFSCFIDIVECADIIVLKGRGGLGFVDKALLGFGIKG